MLNIDNKDFEIEEQKISVGEFVKDKEQGYNINIKQIFIDSTNGEKGYINLDAGFEKTDGIKNFLNREYYGAPFADDDQYIYFEAYDTVKFLDDIDSKVIIKLNDLKNNKVKTSFEVNDELIHIIYDGYLDLDFEETRDTFLE